MSIFARRVRCCLLLVAVTVVAGCPMNGGDMGMPMPIGSAFEKMGDDAVYTQGNVGVGTDAPTERLEVTGNTKVNGTVFADAFSSNSPLHLQTADDTRIFVDDTTGNVGIGTESPESRLHVENELTVSGATAAAFVESQMDDDGPVFALKNTASSGQVHGTFQFENLDGAVGKISYDGPSNAMIFSAGLNAPERMRLTGTGRLGIRTMSPTSTLQVDGPISESALNVRVNNITRLLVDSTGRVGVGPVTPTENLHVGGNICATGTIGACSDARYKDKVAALDDALGTIEQLQPVRFDWKREAFPDHQFSDQRQTGLIAQEVRAVMPEIVSEGSTGYLSVDYGRLTPTLVQAVRELRAEKDAQIAERDCVIQALQAENAAQQARIDAFEARLAALERVVCAVETE